MSEIVLPEAKIKVNGSEVGIGKVVFSHKPIEHKMSEFLTSDYSMIHIYSIPEVELTMSDTSAMTTIGAEIQQRENVHLRSSLQAAIDMKNSFTDGTKNVPKEVREMCIAAWKGDLDQLIPMMDKLLDHYEVSDMESLKIKNLEKKLADASELSAAQVEQINRLLVEIADLKEEEEGWSEHDSWIENDG